MQRTVVALGVLLAGGLVGCGGSGGDALPDGGLGTRTFGQPCATLDDCVSGLCLATGTGSSVCTQICTSDLDCPNTVSWGCISADGFEPQLCGCVADSDEERCGDSRDNDCDGVVDDCRICDGRFVADDDPEHCGGCGNACGPGNLCLDGECVCANVDELLCDGACVDPNASPFHCGRCGRACEDGRECVDGECGCPESRPDLCEGRGCFDFADDAFNCGACGVRCPLAQRCIEGECACPADAGSTLCGSECVDTDTNTRHCGSCGNVCPFGTTCVDGECDCGFGAEQCGSACVETSTDPANCGACGNVCRGDQTCIAGTCRCPTGNMECGGVCIDTGFDANNCGSCGMRCPTGAICDGGRCACMVNEAVCGGRCIDVFSDTANCGRCGVTCGLGEFCNRGTCTCPSGVSCGTTCMPVDDRNHCGACGNACSASQNCVFGSCRCALSGQTACSDGCHDLRSDPANCGSCGNACRPGELCSSSRCACPFGQAWCASAGTCVSLNTTSNCGSCGNACRSGEVCSGGACRCPSGTSWCESAGTCVSLSNDAANCGACGNACRVGEVCSFSVCRCPLTNQAWCDGTCIDVVSDEANCGSCGNVCAADATCESRTCRCSVAGRTSCGADGCRDLQSDAQHCGTCGNACAAGQYCAAGACLCPVATPGAPIELGYAYDPITWDAVWDGDELTTVQSDFAGSLELTWIDAAGAGGNRTVTTTIDGGFEDLLRLRIVPSSVGWNVLVQTEDRGTGARAHYFVRLGSDRSLLSQRRLDSSVAPWVEADLTYVPGTGPVLTWITGTPSTAFVRVLNEDGSNAGGSVVLGSASGVPSIAYDGTGELAVAIANGSPVRLRTYFLSPTLVVRATHDDIATVVADRAFVQGRAGDWLVAARVSSTSTRVLRGPRLVVAASRPISNPRALHWVGDEVAVFSGGSGPLGSPAASAITFRRFGDALTPAIDAALTLTSWERALGVARVSDTRALVVGVNPSVPGIFGAVLDLGDCPR